MKLDKANALMEQVNKTLRGKKSVKTEQESVGEPEISDTVFNDLGDAYVTFLAKVEKGTGHEFDTPKAAFDFLNKVVRQFRTQGRSVLNKKLRVFERLGAQKTLQRARRGMK